MTPQTRGDPTAASAHIPPHRPWLPYAVVMATGAAAQLAPAAGVWLLQVPLVLWASALALWIAGRGALAAVRARRLPAWPADFGAFTIPIGAAVVGVGLAGTDLPGAAPVAALAVAVGWLTTVLVAWVLVRARSRGLCDGTWFLAPAAPLADSIGLVVLTPGAAPFARLLWGLAVAACAIGVLGYLLVVVLALLRVRRHGMAGAPPVCWWVATGCGGLAAASIGHVVTAPEALPVTAAGRGSAVLVWAIACVVLVPILVLGARHLLRRRLRCTAVVWPPTFSMGVFALGAGQVSRLLGSEVLTGVFHVAAASTVAFWAVTTWLAIWVRVRPTGTAG